MPTSANRPGTIAALALVAALVLGACTAGDEIAADPGPGGEGSVTDLAPEAVEAELLLGARADDVATTALGPDTSIDTKLIREATMQLRVEPGSFDERWESIRRIASQLGGYVGDASTGIDERSEGDRFAYGTATVRVPADRFDDALDRFGGLGDRLSQSMSGTDVTEEYIDLEARLRHWTSVEEFTLGLLEQAETIDEAIVVQQRLNDIQLTVEQLEGRIRFLDARTDMATVTVSITEAPGDVVPVVEEEPEPGPIAEAVDQAVEVLLGTVGFLIVAAAFLLPLSLVALALALVWRATRRTGAARSDAA